MLRSLISRALLLSCNVLVTTNSYGTEAPKLSVYTYDSFISDWGPGPALKINFERECACTLNFIPVTDGSAVLARLQIEKSSTKADVVVGIDDTLIAAAEATQLFDDAGIKITDPSLPSGYKPSSKFIPYDIGYYSFIFDTKARTKDGKPYPRPETMDELLSNPQLARSVIIQDPRTSAPGLGLLLWIHARYGQKGPEKLDALKKQVLTVSRGWSDSYNLFTKGEAPIVFSYTTSEAYHRDAEKTDRYQALIFKDGHYPAIETMAVLKSSKHPELARKFIKFMTLPNSQAIIASKNWMYPVTSVPEGLPPSYALIKKPQKILRFEPSEIQKNRGNWIQEWQKALGR